MKIEDIAEVYQGITLSRIKNKDVETEKHLIYSFLDEEKNYIEVPKDNKSKAQIPITKKGMVLLNLTSHRASVIEEEEQNMVIPSTFMVLVPNDKIIPEYLNWYINESIDFKRSIEIIKQGSIVLSIPIQSFKEMKINASDITVQKSISNISKLIKKNKSLIEEKESLLKKVLKHINQEAQKHDKQ